MKNSFPSYNLTESLKTTSELFAKIGSEVVDRNGLLDNLGLYTGGRANNMIGSLGHYGLLVRKSYLYRLSPNALKYFRDTSSRAQLLKQFATKPELFGKLNKKYGSNLPKNIHSILKSEFAIPENKTDLVIKNYNDAVMQFLDNSATPKPSNQKQFAPSPVPTLSPVYPQLSGVELPSFNKEKEEDKYVEIDFGSGLVAKVPKRLILKAYLKELEELAQNY